MSEEKSEKKKVCMICGKPSESSICDECKAKIQGEAAGEKEKLEKQVRVGSEVEKDRLVKKHLNGKK
jgi:hypothetical protein